MKPRRILLVDDDPHDVELALLALDRLQPKVEVEVLRDGAEALEQLLAPPGEKGRPSVMILDLKMPRLNGLELLRQIRSHGSLSGIPVVAFTSSRHRKDIRESYQCGVNAYVVKPLEFQEFIRTVEAIGAFWTGTNVPESDSA